MPSSKICFAEDVDCCLRRHARRSPLRRRPAGSAGGQARADRKAVGPVACRNSTSWSAWPARSNVLAKVVYHKLADPDHKKLRTLCRRRRPAARQQRLLLAAGAQDRFQRRPVRRVDQRPQSGHLCRGPLHQADRLHVRPRLAATPHHLHRPARPRRPGRRPDLGLRRNCRSSTLTPTAAKRPSTSTPVGSRPTTSPAMSSRKCNSASTTASGTPTAQARRRVHDRRQDAQRTQDTRRTIITTARSSNPGASARSAATASRFSAFFEEVAYVEYGGPAEKRGDRLKEMSALTYNDLSADRNCVAIVQAMEAILKRHAEGEPGCLVEVNGSLGGLVLYPRRGEPTILYPDRV